MEWQSRLRKRRPVIDAEQEIIASSRRKGWSERAYFREVQKNTSMSDGSGSSKILCLPEPCLSLKPSPEHELDSHNSTISSPSLNSYQQTDLSMQTTATSPKNDKTLESKSSIDEGGLTLGDVILSLRSRKAFHKKIAACSKETSAGCSKDITPHLNQIYKQRSHMESNKNYTDLDDVTIVCALRINYKLKHMRFTMRSLSRVPPNSTSPHNAGYILFADRIKAHAAERFGLDYGFEDWEICDEINRLIIDEWLYLTERVRQRFDTFARDCQKRPPTNDHFATIEMRNSIATSSFLPSQSFGTHSQQNDRPMTLKVKCEPLDSAENSENGTDNDEFPPRLENEVPPPLALEGEVEYSENKNDVNVQVQLESDSISSSISSDMPPFLSVSACERQEKRVNTIDELIANVDATGNLDRGENNFSLQSDSLPQMEYYGEPPPKLQLMETPNCQGAENTGDSDKSSATGSAKTSDDTEEILPKRRMIPTRKPQILSLKGNLLSKFVNCITHTDERCETQWAAVNTEQFREFLSAYVDTVNYIESNGEYKNADTRNKLMDELLTMTTFYQQEANERN